MNADELRMAATTVSCSTEFSMRYIIRNGTIFVVREGQEGTVLWFGEGSIASGYPGVGVRSAPSGNGITRVEMYPLDTVLPPALQRPAVAAFDYRVDMQR
jgi:hypothetical protein